VGPIESLTHEGREVVFNNRKVGELSQKLLKTLKSIQYGLIEDRHGWMTAL
jgi:branched-chain amino acid aminotransferase